MEKRRVTTMFKRLQKQLPEPTTELHYESEFEAFWNDGRARNPFSHPLQPRRR